MRTTPFQITGDDMQLLIQENNFRSGNSNFGFTRMTRHSKNANARSFVSSEERSKSKNAIERERSSVAGSRLPFGFCCLTLRPAKNPVASPQGWIFDKDAVVEFLVSEKDLLGERLAAWDARHVAAITQPIKDSKKRCSDEISGRSKSFWVNPASAGTDERAVLLGDRPDTTPRCPMSGEKLRLKELVAVKLESTTVAEADKGIYSCAISRRPITHQQALLLKPSGIVVLESAFKETVPDGSRCPISGMPLSGSDVIKLQKGRLV